MRYVENLRADATMNNLSSILTVVVAIAIAGIAYLWRRASALEGQLRRERKGLADRSSEAERFAQQAKGKARELERTKKQLHETRAKMKRLQKESGAVGGKRARASEPDPNPSEAGHAVAAVVRISNQELEARYAEKLASMEADLHAAHERVRTLESAASRREQEAEEARRALMRNTPASGTAEQQLAALEKRLEAYRSEASAAERKLKKAVARAEAKERAATRRANNNHSLYLVIKGQLELAEDKVALFRRRYEGAKTPNQVRIESEPTDTDSASANRGSAASQTVASEQPPTASAATPSADFTENPAARTGPEPEGAPLSTPTTEPTEVTASAGEQTTEHTGPNPDLTEKPTQSAAPADTVAPDTPSNPEPAANA